MNENLQLYIDPPRDGPTNMALDSALLDKVPTAGAALRLYRWQPATLSLGYFQHFADPARLSDPILSRIPVVRRCTGGGAILHADELTYSLALPLNHPLAGPGEKPADLYDWVHARIAEAIAAIRQEGTAAISPRGGKKCAAPRKGPFLCFACHASFDLMAAGQKLAGSAQRRTRTGLLQHGSVILNRTHPIQPSSAVAEIIGRQVSFEEMAEALAQAVRAAGVELIDEGQTSTTLPTFGEHYRLHSSSQWIERL